MPPVNVVLLVAGSILATALLLIGYWLGRRRALRSASIAHAPLVEDDDRQRIAGLLHSLAQWTSEYAGNVSTYQSDLRQISQSVRQNLKAVQQERRDGGGKTSVEEQNLNNNRVLTLLTQIMSVNDALQTRLDAAESQLEEQTQQIESYLTEARTDALTGLFNRRAFDKKLDELFTKYRGGGSSFALILIDIDHFKSINDTYGHPIGDIVLQRVAALLGANLSDAKIVARFGGEEFSVLTEMPIRTAADRMNKIRHRIEEEAISVQGQLIRLTISVGMSEPRDEIVVGPLVRRADEALYCAKNRGRNRVYFNDGNGPYLFGAPEIVKS